jgi:hypothetical protein
MTGERIRQEDLMIFKLLRLKPSVTIVYFHMFLQLFNLAAKEKLL